VPAPATFDRLSLHQKSAAVACSAAHSTLRTWEFDQPGLENLRCIPDIPADFDNDVV